MRNEAPAAEVQRQQVQGSSKPKDCELGDLLPLMRGPLVAIGIDVVSFGGSEGVGYLTGAFSAPSAAP